MCVAGALGGTPAAAGTKAPLAASAQSSPTCGGEWLPPKPDGSHWTCSFDDEFNSTTGDATALNTSWWTPQDTASSGYTTGPTGYQVCYVNSPSNVWISGGALHLTVRKKAAPFACDSSLTTQYTGGMVTTANSFRQTYGRFEVRALLPRTTVAGLQETLWLYPAQEIYGPWPASGEVDFAEFYSEYPTLDIPYIHYYFDSTTVNPATNTNVVTNYCPIAHSQYNNYAVTWSPGSFTITVNGKTCLTDNYVPNGGLTEPQPFDQPFFVILTQALGGPGTNAFNPATTPLPASLSVDYVRVWK